MMDRIGYETTQTEHYFQIDGSRSMTPAALLSALQEMAISHSDSLGFSVQYNLTHHCFWSVVNWHLKLYRMPKYNETITLQTWSDKFARFQANRSFFLFDENGNKLLCDSSDTTVYSYDTFGMLKNMSCPAVLAEQCFITNPSDVESFGTEEGCQRAAQAYYKAICNYLEHAK